MRSPVKTVFTSRANSAIDETNSTYVKQSAQPHLQMDGLNKGFQTNHQIMALLLQYRGYITAQQGGWHPFCVVDTVRKQVILITRIS